MKTYEFVKSSDGRAYTVTVIEGDRRRTLPVVLYDRKCYPMRDACMAVLLDWLDDADNREFQAASLAVAMVTRVNRLVAKRKNRAWNHFVLTEAEVGAMVADLLVDSYRFSVDAAFLSVEHLSGHRRDHLRQAIDFCVVPRRIC